jgi:hypothetical protein
MRKTYLGDGVNVAFEGTDFILTTENGIEVTNIIYLEFEIIQALMAYAIKCVSEPNSGALDDQTKEDGK